MEKRIAISTLAASAVPATGVSYGPAFWEFLWRTAGLQSVGLFIAARLLYGHLPLVAILLAGLAVLNLMWFAAALRAALAEAGRDGWGAAATAASAATGGLLLLVVAMTALLAYPATGAANALSASTSNGPAWAIWVITSFPRAMLIMAGSFGFWRAKWISNSTFALCVLAVILVLLGGATWIGDGSWAPDGLYSRLVSPIIGLAWILAASWVLLTRSPGMHEGW